ncbi:hypothetical protein ACU8KH_03036 [Lachancea thermotolerans]
MRTDELVSQAAKFEDPLGSSSSWEKLYYRSFQTICCHSEGHVLLPQL